MLKKIKNGLVKFLKSNKDIARIGVIEKTLKEIELEEIESTLLKCRDLDVIYYSLTVIEGIYGYLKSRKIDLDDNFIALLNKASFRNEKTWLFVEFDDVSFNPIVHSGENTHEFNSLLEAVEFIEQSATSIVEDQNIDNTVTIIKSNIDKKVNPLHQAEVTEDFEDKFKSLQTVEITDDLFIAFFLNHGSFSNYVGIPFTETELQYIKVKLDIDKVKKSGRNIDEMTADDLHALDYPSLFSFALDGSYK